MNTCRSVLIVIMLLSFMPTPALSQDARQIASAGAPFVQWEVRAWFERFDQIRRSAQMSPDERALSYKLLKKGLPTFLGQTEKVEAHVLTRKMIGRYGRATQEMRRLPRLPATGALADAYYRYFVTARLLFLDYLKVQDNPLAVDNQSTPIFVRLTTRRGDLEKLERTAKSIDRQTREKYRVPAYQYKLKS